MPEVSFKYAAVTKKSTTTKEDLYKASKEILDETKKTTKLSIYTDGSAINSNTYGGAGVIIYKDDKELMKICMPAGRWTSSFQSEMAALSEALKICEHMEDMSIRIVTDSQSTMMRLENTWTTKTPNDHIEANIIKSLEKCAQNGAKFTMVWCPSHCGTEGNEAADKLAEEGTRLEQNIPYTYETAKTCIRRHIRAPPLRHPTIRRIYQDGRKKDSDLTRSEQVNISRLRCNHHTNLRYWTHKVGLTEDDRCRLCGLTSETVEHIFERCNGMNDERGEIDVTILNTNPKKALDFWKKWEARAGSA